jgi:SHS2 domain-containing protein
MISHKLKPIRKFHEHTADVLFTAEAPTLPELFEQCALAVEETMVNLEKVGLKKKKEIKLKNKNLEMLLFDFLEQLVFYKDAEQLIFRKFEIKIKEGREIKEEKMIKENNRKQFILHCSAWGEKIAPERHEPKVDIKAITMHLFELKQIKGKWWAQVLVDI